MTKKGFLRVWHMGKGLSGEIMSVRKWRRLGGRLIRKHRRLEKQRALNSSAESL